MALVLPKSVFVHIPKTGGTWVRRAIEKSMGLEKDSSEIELPSAEKWGHLAHAKVKDLKREANDVIEDRFMFAFVRNPLDWLKSCYMEKVYPEFVDYNLNFVTPPKEKITFKEFVLEKGEGYVSRLYRQFLKSPKNIYPFVNYIGRAENLKEDLIEALEIAGEDFDKTLFDNIPMQRQGASVEKNKKLIEVDEETLQFIEEGESEAINLFYSKNSYSNVQQCIYDRLASLWSVDKKNYVVGSFDAQNEWQDYQILFDGMFDFHDNAPHLSLAKNSTVLDFGCGPGRNLEKYASNFKRVDGVDISHVNLDNAEEWLKLTGSWRDNLLFKSNGVDLSEIEDNQYDAVMSTITLQHICVYDIRFNLFKEFRRVLKSGGWFTAQMGYGEGKIGAVPYHKNHYNIGKTNGATDVFIPSKRYLANDLKKAGFTNLEFKIRPAGPGDTHPNWIFFKGRAL